MTKLLSVVRRPGRFASLWLAALALGAGPVSAQTPVYPWPGDASWFPMNRMWGLDPSVAAFISPVNPRYGNGSLSLATTGSLFDWAFYATLSGENPWGRLGDISHLSFEWYRSALPYADAGSLPAYITSWPDAPWLAQTPVLRLLLGQQTQSGLVMSELVWEKYYTDGTTTAFDSWVPENLLSQRFWYNVGGQMYSVSNCEYEDPETVTPPPVWELLLGTPGGWAGGSFANASATSACENFSLSDAWVYGISVGVGSNWPDAYQGYVDYVHLAFDDQDAVFANFEFPETVVPEPATVVLLGSGLLGLGATALLRRRRRDQEA